MVPEDLEASAVGRAFAWAFFEVITLVGRYVSMIRWQSRRDRDFHATKGNKGIYK